jgi:hypothetical protein
MSHTRISIEKEDSASLQLMNSVFFKRVDNSQLSTVRLRSAKGQTSSRAGEHWGVASVAERWSHGDAKGFNFYFAIGMY